MKPQTLILPLNLPRLSERGAAQLIALLHELVTAVEYYYAAQSNRDRRPRHEKRPSWQLLPETPDDPPF